MKKSLEPNSCRPVPAETRMSCGRWITDHGFCCDQQCKLWGHVIRQVGGRCLRKISSCPRCPTQWHLMKSVVRHFCSKLVTANTVFRYKPALRDSTRVILHVVYCSLRFLTFRFRRGQSWFHP